MYDLGVLIRGAKAIAKQVSAGLSMALSLTPDTITLAEFEGVLSRYDALIQSVSKPSNKGGETLAQLEIYRLLTIPARLDKVREEGGALYLDKEEVERLIRWKLYVYLCGGFISLNDNDVLVNTANFAPVY